MKTQFPSLLLIAGLFSILAACQKGNINNTFSPPISAITSGLQDNSLVSLDINGDGRFIVFSTSVSLVANDQDNLYDIYRYDRVNNTTQLISSNLVSNSFGVSIDNSGNKILYTASQSLSQPSSPTAIYLWDNGNIITLQEGQADPLIPNFFSPLVAFNNIISPDGNLVGAHVNLNHIIFDLTTSQSVVLGQGQPIDFSTNSRYHTWSNVDIANPSAAPNIFVYDRQTGSNTPITNTTKYSGQPMISGDGQFTVFESELGNLTGAEDNNGLNDVFVFDASKPSYRRLSPADANGPSTFPDISDDGQVIVFASSANNMGLIDNNLLTDIIVEINGRKTNLTGNADNESSVPRISNDGRFVAFVSGATNLPGGTSQPNIYIAGPLR
jgi:Tol biopolymer transport system component